MLSRDDGRAAYDGNELRAPLTRHERCVFSWRPKVEAPHAYPGHLAPTSVASQNDRSCER